MASLGRPGTAMRPTTGYRPCSALKPYTAGKRPNSRLGTQNRSSLSPGSAFQKPEMARPSTARPGSTGKSAIPLCNHMVHVGRCACCNFYPSVKIITKGY